MSLWRPYFSLPGFAETDPVYAHTVPRDQAGHFPSINTGIPTQRRPLSSPKLKCEYTLWYIQILRFVTRICSVLLAYLSRVQSYEKLASYLQKVSVPKFSDLSVDSPPSKSDSSASSAGNQICHMKIQYSTGLFREFATFYSKDRTIKLQTLWIAL